MSTVNLLPKDESSEQTKPHEPSMEEILASIRRIIAEDQALAANPGISRGAAVGLPGLDKGSEQSARAAFNTLVASRFVQHSDVIVGLTREMLRPLLKSWLDEHLPAIVERLVAAEIERIARGE